MKNDWTNFRLGDCIKLISGGTPSKSNPEFWGGDIPWVSSKDMKVSRLYDTEDHLTKNGSKNGTRLVPKNTILIVVRSMILAQSFPIAWTMREVAFNQDIKAINCKEVLLPKFLYYWLKANSYNILGIVDEAAHGTKRIQTDRFENLEISLPTLLYQKQIAELLSSFDNLIDIHGCSVKQNLVKYPRVLNAVLPTLIYEIMGNVLVKHVFHVSTSDS
jgi:type I restriction enzyme S subunit